MPKEKSYNPVQAANKAEKARQIKKQKSQLQAQRNEKLARRNPARLQRDIDALKDSDQNGTLRPHERQRLQELERDLAAVNKARAALGDKAPEFKFNNRPEQRDRDQGGDRGRGRGGERGRGRGRGGSGVLGKRGRDGGWKGREDGRESSDTDEDVRHIPMPRDTPPPIPRRHGRDAHGEEQSEKPQQPTLVYEAAPQVRDLRKEATRFMPAAVAQKMRLAKGEGAGRLLEPEEFDKLKEEGYLDKAKAAANGENDEEVDAFLRTHGVELAAQGAAEAATEEAEHDMMAAEAKGQMHDPATEGSVAENRLHHVEIEEVEDEDL